MGCRARCRFSQHRDRLAPGRASGSSPRALTLSRSSPRGEPGINLIVIDKFGIAAVCQSHSIANRVGLPFVELQIAFDCLNCERVSTAINSCCKFLKTPKG